MEAVPDTGVLCRTRATLSRWGSLIKFSHTIFALPFALSMLVVLSRSYDVRVGQVLWILAALTSARTAAMAFNRLIDRHIDARNPRTKNRELPAGVVSVTSVNVLLAISSLTFLMSSAMLGSHCLVLAPLVLGWLLMYSWTKRVTQWSHAVLGIALALAPGGVWYAFTAQFALLPVWLMLAVACWVCGFDILYSCQDIDFDKEQQLHSIPAKLGVHGAFYAARIFHAAAIVLLWIFGVNAGLGTVYFSGVVLFGGLLISQHCIIKPDDLRRINAAFFERNALASIAYLLAVSVDVFIYSNLH